MLCIEIKQIKLKNRHLLIKLGNLYINNIKVSLKIMKKIILKNY